MKMRLKRKSILILSLAAFFAFGMVISGCSAFASDGEKMPASVIRDAYGNEQFKITFYAANLAEPISDIYYTAQNMPKLPTPVKVGYVFEGWYFDSEYTKPYEDGSLYMYMCDVTLYAKWTKEEFAQNGIYQIEYSLEILESTLSKGALCDEYGGYKNFADALVEGEVYFEKSEKGTLLRFQYDSGYLASDVYTVMLSSRNGSKFMLAASETVDTVTDTLKTFYIDWGDNEIDSTLYLDVRTLNYETEGLTDSQRVQTAASYTMKFKVTEFLGYTRSFVDTSMPLDDGYYLVRTYFSSDSNGESTMDSFNPVYSYLIAENGSYTLIKPFYSYAGLVGEGMSTDYYYNRFMTFAPMRLCYDIAPVGDESISANYLPAAYDGGYYCNVAVEFHADTGRYYHVIDIGDNINRDFIVVNTVTGMMELMTHMGTNNVIMTIDREHIIKLTDIDYEPLTGDAYEYNGDEFAYYAGDSSDFSYSSYMYDSLIKYGSCIPNVNFFWSAASAGADYSDRTVYSSRIEYSPTGATNEIAVSQSRYQVATFTSHAQVFGYDGYENLYADCYSTSTIANVGLRETIQVVNGKSCTVGESLSVGELYAQYVNSEADFSEVEFRAYAMNGYNIDYSSPVSLNETFTFDSSIAIVFTRIGGDGEKTAVLELAKYTSPAVSIEVNNDDIYNPSDTERSSGAIVKYANVIYSWMGGSGSFIDGYYEEDKIILNPVRARKFCIVDGEYVTGYSMGEDNSGGFYMPSYDTVVVYEMTNRYGERTYYYTYFTVTGNNLYSLTHDGEDIASGRYTENASGGFKSFRIYDWNYGTAYDDTLDSVFAEEYVVTNASGEHKMTISSVLVRSYELYTSLSAENYDSYDAFIAAVKKLLTAQPYAYFSINYYTDEGDLYTRFLLYNVYFNGKSGYAAMPYETYFTGTQYSLTYFDMCDEDGVVFGMGSYELYSYAGGTQSQVGSLATTGSENGKYLVKFNAPGKYQLVYNASLLYDENGRKLFGISNTSATALNLALSVRFIQTIEVIDKNSTVTIHYTSTEGHPFAEGVADGDVLTISYDLANDKIVVPSISSFEATSSTFVGWAARPDITARDTSEIIVAGSAIPNFITRFNAQEVTLYPVWGDKITVTVVSNIEIEGFTPITYELSMTASTGWYSIDIFSAFGSELNKYSTGIYNFVGFTGGFVGSGVATSSSFTRYIMEGQSDDYYVITAVFTRTYTVKYDITATNEAGERYSTTYFGYTSVTSGGIIEEPSRSVVCKIDGYEFKYWAIKSDNGELVYFDVANTPVTDDMADDEGYITLYAVFGLTGE